MQFSNLDIIDLLIRVGAIGQLLLLGGVFSRPPFSGAKLAFLGVAVCTVAYLALTAPIPNAHYGYWRNLLLVFTDALGYSVWFTALYFLDDSFAPGRWPRTGKAALAVFALWHIYFFGVLQAQGVFHDLSHAIAVLLMAHVFYVALKGRSDDLVDSRRKTRILIATIASLFGLYLAITELTGDALRQSALFGLGNSIFILLAITLLARYILSKLLPPAAPPLHQGRVDRPLAPMSAQTRKLKDKLEAFIAGGHYRQTGLTITALARQLDCPEHQLRRLINTTLGFRNFSAFLNHYRIPDACEQLSDPQNPSPILTIALNLGYGSIGPFNRAFKAITGLTPGQYRASFQNRP